MELNTSHPLEMSMKTAKTWQPASSPPETEPGCWSRDVVVVTNYGSVYHLAYFGSKKDGVWQRLASMEASGEKVEYCFDDPHTLNPTMAEAAENFREEAKAFCWIVAEEFYIIRFLNWLEKKLNERNSRRKKL